METSETRKKLADGIRQLQSSGNTQAINQLVSAYKNKYQTPQQPPVNNSQVESPNAKYPVDRTLTNIGVGIGSEIGKAGLGIGQTFLKGANIIGNVIGAGKNQYDPLIKNIETIKQNVYQKPFEKQLNTTSGAIGKGIGVAIPYVLPSGAITKAQQGITSAVSRIPATGNLAKAGRGTLGVVGRAVPEATSAGLTGLAVTGGDTNRAKSDAFIAGAISTALGSFGAIGRGVKESGLSKNVLSKTSGIPKTAFEAVDGVGINNKATPEQALDSSRKAVQLLRQKTTKFWQDSIPKIEETYKGSNLSFDKPMAQRLLQVMDEFGVDPQYIPKNLNKVSALESINLMKGLNELDSLAIKASPKGAVVRQLKKELKPLIIENFGGDKGAISKLWSEYSVKSKILENMDSIVQTYRTKPTQTVTAKNRLMAIFDENKPEFLSAVKEIEKELGINLTRDIASTKFQNILPKGILKADGGLPTQAGIVDKIIKALALPVTSPKLAGKLATIGKREAGPIEQRLFGNYRDIKSINQKTQESINIPSITKPKNSNINIPNTEPPTTQKSTGVINTIKKSLGSDIHNKEGGFVRIGKENPKTVVPKSKVSESVSSLNDDIKIKISKELEQYDTAPVKVNGKLDFSNSNVDFRLDELKAKEKAGKMTNAEYAEAKGLLEEMGVSFKAKK